MRANWSVSRVVSKIALKARSKTKMRDCYPKQVELEHSNIVSISAHDHASAAMLKDGTVYTWGRVAVPKHSVFSMKPGKENDEEKKENVETDHHGHDGLLTDRTLPVRNTLLTLEHAKKHSHHAIQVSVTETAIVVIYDSVDHKRVEKIRLKKQKDDERKRKEKEARRLFFANRKLQQKNTRK